MSHQSYENKTGWWARDNSLWITSNTQSSAELMQSLYGKPFIEDEVREEMNNFTPEMWKSFTNSILEFSVNEERSMGELFTYTQYFHKLFCFDHNSDTGTLDRIGHIYGEALAMQAQYERFYNQYRAIHEQFKRVGYLNLEHQIGRELSQLLTRISFGIRTSYEIIVNIRLLKQSEDSGLRAVLLKMTPATFFPPPLENEEKLQPFAQLIDFYYHYAFQRRYRLYKDCIYRPVYNDDNIFVHAYEYQSTLKEFVADAVYPIEQNRHWFNILISSPSYVNQVVEKLSVIKSEWLPALVKNRDIFAFSNGLYILPLDEFFWFRLPPNPPVDDQGKCTLKLVSELSGNLTAIKYHNQYFDELAMIEEVKPDGHPMRIALPNIKLIFQTQGYTIEEMFFIFGLLGRMFHIVKRFDTWGVFIWLLGMGNTGKSTILFLIAQIYDSCDVGYLNNRQNEAFALESIYESKMFFGMDLDDQFSFDQATFQSMVVGEIVGVNRKNKPQISIEWQSHGAFAGNVMPKWQSVGGNLTRRIIPIEFGVVVSKNNPQLYQLCVSERPRMIKVFNACYLFMVMKFRHQSLKDALPAKFKQMEERIMREINPIESFVNECCILSDPSEELFMSYTEFQDAFKWWAADNNLNSNQSKMNSTTMNSLVRFGVKIDDTNNNNNNNKRQRVDDDGSASVDVSAAASKRSKTKGRILMNITLQEHVIPLVAEWKTSKQRR